MHLILQETDRNTVFSMFIIKYTSIFNQCFPLVIKKSFQKRKNWFDEELLKLIKEKDKLLKKYIAKKTIAAKAKHEEARNKYFHSIQEEKEAFYASGLQKQKQY